MHIRKIVKGGAIAATGALVAFAFAPGAAMASARSVLLGTSNSTTLMTTITNTKGTPLYLRAPAGRAPLAVNSSKTVTNLSADRLDGLSSGSFSLAGGRTGIIYGSATDKDGFINTVACPTGTVATGGGGVALSQDGVAALDYSGPDFIDAGTLFPNSWFVTSTDNNALAWVTCYNPRGKVAGASSHLPTAAAANAAAGASSTHAKLQKAQPAIK